MRFIDIHLIVIAILGLGIFGLGLGSQIAVLWVLIASQFILVTRNLLGPERQLKKLVINEVIVILLCGTVFFVIQHTFPDK